MTTMAKRRWTDEFTEESQDLYDLAESGDGDIHSQSGRSGCLSMLALLGVLAIIFAVALDVAENVVTRGASTEFVITAVVMAAIAFLLLRK